MYKLIGHNFIGGNTEKIILGTCTERKVQSLPKDIVNSQPYALSTRKMTSEGSEHRQKCLEIEPPCDFLNIQSSMKLK